MSLAERHTHRATAAGRKPELARVLGGAIRVSCAVGDAPGRLCRAERAFATGVFGAAGCAELDTADVRNAVHERPLVDAGDVAAFVSSAAALRDEITGRSSGSGYRGARGSGLARFFSARRLHAACDLRHSTTPSGGPDHGDRPEADCRRRRPGSFRPHHSRRRLRPLPVRSARPLAASP